MARKEYCRHFTGIQHKTCAAGVVYRTMWDNSVKPHTLPCTPLACSVTCDRYAPQTPEEIKAQDAYVENFCRELNEGKTCPHCHAPIAQREQVGRCLYARPCGHRLGQVGFPRERSDNE